MKAETKHFKKGMIILWSGAIADIPGGWALCDGTNGTPNLKNNFVVGAGEGYVVGEVGGSVWHDHDFTGDGHTHDLIAGSDIGPGANYSLVTDSDSSTGTTESVVGMPPYYALAYIMKL